MENKTPQQEAERTPFYRFHQNLQSAFIQAGQVCMIWRTPESDQKYNAFQMEKLVREFDAENPCPEGCCYEVSVEGAIGFCPGRQYLTRWLFYPAMDDKSLEEFVKDMYQKLDEIKAEEEAAEAAAAAAAAPAEPEAPASAPVARFCPNCGQPYPDDETRFCPNCGTPRQ